MKSEDELCESLLLDVPWTFLCAGKRLESTGVDNNSDGTGVGRIKGTGVDISEGTGLDIRDGSGVGEIGDTGVSMSPGIGVAGSGMTS